jgi:hypothetical protein
MRELQKECETIFHHVTDKPGLGMVLMMFESRDWRSDAPVAIVSHGMGTDKVVRMLREQADRLERVVKEERTVQVNEPVIVKPS